MLRPVLYTSQIGIRISSSDLSELEKAAKELGMSKTLIARTAIQEFLRSHNDDAKAAREKYKRGQRSEASFDKAAA